MSSPPFLQSILFAWVVLASFCIQASEPVSFSKGHLKITEGVEDFVQAAAAAYFSHFSQADVILERDSHGQIVDRMENGALRGEFKGLFESEGEQSEIHGVFSVETQKEALRGREYEIHVRTSGSISNSELFISHHLDNLKQACQSDNSVYCPESFPTSVSPVDQVLELAQQMKLRLLETLQAPLHPQLESIRADLIPFLDQRIFVGREGDQAVIRLNLGDLAPTFRQQAGLFLNDYEMIDYSYQEVEVIVTNEEIHFESHLIKYHVIKAFDAAMMGLGQMQDTLEDTKAGANVGRDLRQGKDLRSALSSNGHWSDLIGATRVLGMERLFGNDSNELEGSEQTLDDLGLN